MQPRSLIDAGGMECSTTRHGTGCVSQNGASIRSSVLPCRLAARGVFVAKAGRRTEWKVAGPALPLPAEKPCGSPDDLAVLAPFGGARTARSGGLRRSLAMPLPRRAGDICPTRSERRVAARMQDREYRYEWGCGTVLRGWAGRFHGGDRAGSAPGGTVRYTHKLTR